jgi:hypothetical protein
MNYSNHHKKFVNNLYFLRNINTQDFLNHPQKYLGPNYKEVLNFWFYWDSLSNKQWYVYRDGYWKLDAKTYNQAFKISKKLASEVIDSRFIKYFWEEPLEIVAAHLYLERNIPFTFLPLHFDL